MEILLADAQLLIELARKSPLGKTITLGRQKVFFQPEDVCQHLEKSGLKFTQDTVPWNQLRDGGPAEPFFQILGSPQPNSLDFSDYEGATLLHDLNEAVPTEWHRRYDTVFDGGTLEHVFNFPVAFRSVMEMVREGGRLVISTPVNNLVGYDFYQFSPELFFNILGEANGFQIEIMAAHELSLAHRVFLVSNPAELKCRLEQSNSCPTILFIAARRVQIKSLFQSVQQQSDYSQEWKENALTPQKGLRSMSHDRRGKVGAIVRKIKSDVPGLIYLLSTFYRVFFEPIPGVFKSQILSSEGTLMWS